MKKYFYFALYLFTIFSCGKMANKSNTTVNMRDSLINAAVAQKKHPAHSLLKQFRQEKFPFEINDNLCNGIDIVNDKFIDSLTNIVFISKTLQSKKLWPIARFNNSDSIITMLATERHSDNVFDYYFININNNAEITDEMLVGKISPEIQIKEELRTFFESANTFKVEKTLHPTETTSNVSEEIFTIDKLGKFVKQ